MTEDDNLKNEIIHEWEDLDIKKNLLRGIYSYGFEKPSPIQKKSINSTDTELRDIFSIVDVSDEIYNSS